MTFLKNYLLIILMGLGFLIAFGSLLLLGEPAKDPLPEPASPEKVQLQVTENDGRHREPLTIERMDGEVVHLSVELAKTQPEWERGFMERAVIPENQGMLFVFQDVAPRSFWMKNVIIPLDMVFIDKDGTIHHIQPNTTPHSLDSIRSNGPVAYVLELGGGVAEKLGIEVGDKVVHPEIHE